MQREDEVMIPHRSRERRKSLNLVYRMEEKAALGGLGRFLKRFDMA